MPLPLRLSSRNSLLSLTNISGDRVFVTIIDLAQRDRNLSKTKEQSLLEFHE